MPQIYQQSQRYQQPQKHQQSRMLNSRNIKPHSKPKSQDCSSMENTMSNKIKVKIFNSFVNVLIDTGCSTSILSEALLKRLHVNTQNLEPSEIKNLIGANGSTIPVIGKINLNIRLHGLTVPYEFLIAKSLTHELMVGHDFMSMTEAVIDYPNNSISFYDHLVVMPFINKHDTVIASLVTYCNLEPRTETIVDVKISRRLADGDYLLESLPVRENQKILTAKILAHVENGRTICRLLNATNSVLHLKQP